MTITETPWAFQYRDRVAAVANRAVRGSKYVHPILDKYSSRETLIDWLATCDPNGVWTDEDRRGEEWGDPDPLTIETAWEAISDVCADGWYLECPKCGAVDSEDPNVRYFDASIPRAEMETWDASGESAAEATHVRCHRCQHEGEYVTFLEGKR